IARGRCVISSSAIISRSQISPCRNLYLRSEAIDERLAGFPAYVSLSRLTTLDSSVASHCSTKLEPINPAPPVTRIGFACIAPELAIHYLAFCGICPASEGSRDRGGGSCGKRVGTAALGCPVRESCGEHVATAALGRPAEQSSARQSSQNRVPTAPPAD